MIPWEHYHFQNPCLRYGNECIQSHSHVSRRHDIYSAWHAKGELQSISLRAEVRMPRGINIILMQFSTLRPPSAWRVIKLRRLPSHCSAREVCIPKMRVSWENVLLSSGCSKLSMEISDELLIDPILTMGSQTKGLKEPALCKLNNLALLNQKINNNNHN